MSVTLILFLILHFWNGIAVIITAAYYLGLDNNAQQPQPVKDECRVTESKLNSLSGVIEPE